MTSSTYGKEKPKKEKEHKPAYIDASDENLKDGFYCWFCGMGWYNCLCCHEED